MKIKESILIIDDDLDFLDIMKRILENKGYEAAAAPSGSEAISLLKGRFYNAVILDISLPDMDGTELLPVLLDIHPDMSVIMLTGHSSVQNAIKSLNLGAFAYLEKPVDTENLLSVISRGLEKQRLIMENRKLMEELEQRNRITNTLLGVSQAVSQSLDLQQIIDSALERVGKTTGIDAGFVYLHENGRLVLRGHRGLSPRLAKEMDIEVENGDGVIGRILEQAKSVILDDISTTADTSLAFLTDGGYQSFAGVPLTILGESIGIMGVATRAEYHFTSRDIQLFTGIAREISIAVRNAQLYEEASSARALRELDMMRTEFLANVSHELRTPLAVIKGSANSLLQPDVIFDDATRREFLQSIDKDADSLTRLVDDLLLMSRLEANALEVRKKPHQLPEVIEMIKDRLDKLTARHHLNVNTPETMPPVCIDDVRIGEVLTNLVENAVKYSKENTDITIDVNPNCKEVVVSVMDEGIGIPPELHQKVFERFFQVDSRKAGRGKGTGLGLAICRGIIEAHSGRIWVESEPSRGSKFSFTLPID